jgi:hypothetical protein
LVSLQPRLGVDHVAAGEALLPPSIFAEFDQFRGCADRRHAIARANGEKLIANPAIALDAITRTQATFTTRDLAAAGPILCWGSRSMPCASRLR